MDNKILKLPDNDPHPTLHVLLDRVSSSIDKLDFGEMTGKEVKKVTLSDMAVCVCESILESNNDFLKRGDKVNIYNGRYWQYIESDLLSKFLTKCSIQSGVSRVNSKKVDFDESIKKQFLHLVNTYRAIDSDEVKINLKSGTFKIIDGKTGVHPFDKNDQLFYQLTFDIDPDATSPMFDKYLDYCLDKESHDTLFYYLAYTILGNQAPNIERALFLEGDGGTGKSVVMNIVVAMLGMENVSNVPLSKFGIKEGMYLQDMEGKLLNYASEIGRNFAVEIFKQVVSKEGIPTRTLYDKKSRTIWDFPALIFNVNLFPRSRETTNAVYRRVIILVFDRVIPDHMKDTELAGKIIKSELAGVFNKILTAIPGVMKLNGKIPISTKSIEALDEYKILDDSIQAFIKEKFYKPSRSEKKEFGEVYNEYAIYCMDNGLLKIAGNKFSTLIRRLGFEIDRARPKRNIWLEVEDEDEEPKIYKDLEGNPISKEESDQKLKELGFDVENDDEIEDPDHFM